MIIPSYVNAKFVDENGYLTPEWQSAMSQLITELQLNLNNEGYVLPELATTDIAKLTDVAKSKGAMVYDSTTNEFKVNINGVWRVVTVV
jgi:hypothetical protein